MDYVIICLIGIAGGGCGVFFALYSHKKKVDELAREANAQKTKYAEAFEVLKSKHNELQESAKQFTAAKSEFESRHASYHQLQDENAILKRDLMNLDINVRKFHLDTERQHTEQEALDQKVDTVGRYYLDDNVKWISKSLNASNFATCKQRLEKVIDRCRKIGFGISEVEASELVDNLRQEYELAVRAAFEREEQARIKSQIREEQQREKEIERELKRLEREREAIKVALEKALADTKDEHSVEVERLRARLKEAEEQSQRAISQAQLTRSGHVYVISNIGSFGEGVFKIGLTRRLEPAVRIKELGDASVPFPFDVHMMISSDDAPTLEKALHHALHRDRLNKANPRKEFFTVDLDVIHRLVKEHHGDVEYVADAEALEYRQSKDMPDEDEEFIEQVYSHLGEPSE